MVYRPKSFTMQYAFYSWKLHSIPDNILKEDIKSMIRQWKGKKRQIQGGENRNEKENRMMQSIWLGSQRGTDYFIYGNWMTR